ncbi:MAG: tetratricopeptide repeat protein [Mediterranea sp.]|jgi:tetratricopeptide (TPR) repeat protein|nr:tetratricopeptide repeat protein [Mediterranea sp.]
MADKKDHKEELNVEDALTQSEAFIIKHKKLIIGSVVAIILIVAGVLIYKDLYADPREEKAQIALFKGQQLFEQDAFETALNGDSINYKGFLKVADEFSGTKAANLARAYAGICYMNLGEYEKAIEELDKFNGADIMVAPSILGAIGNSYANLGQLDKATSYLIKAANQADNNTLSPIFLMQAGNIYEKQGKFTDAVKAYTKIKDNYFRSYQAMDIDKYIERANLQK